MGHDAQDFWKIERFQGSGLSFLASFSAVPHPSHSRPQSDFHNGKLKLFW
jgi:hypothetical protein